MKLVALVLSVLLCISSHAQDASGSKSRWEIGAFTGNLILAKVPNVIDNIPPFVVKISHRSSVGVIEASLLHGRGNEMMWRSGMLDYRFDFDDLQLPFHALFGFQFDAYQVYDGGATSYGGGWHYGGGAHFEIVPNLIFRADFVNRFGPGRSLLVLVGLAIGFGSAQGN